MLRRPTVGEVKGTHGALLAKREVYERYGGYSVSDARDFIGVQR